MAHEIVENARKSMEKAISNLASEYATVRTGRASAKNLEHIMVDYYNVATPITQVASVKVPEAHMLVVEPWDKSLLGPIEKAITASDLGITPSNDGMVIRLPFPAPTEERRRELVKTCGKYAEDTKVAIRNARRDANSKAEKACKASEITEDDQRRLEGEIQKLTDSYVARASDMFSEKEAEVMEI